MRAGSLALSLLSSPVDAHVLEALEEGPLSLIDLRQAVGSPPQTTIRSHLRQLEKLAVVERQRQRGFPGSIDYELAPRGRELLGVAEVLGRWLAVAPGGPMQAGTIAAKSSITALVDGWSSTIVRALAARPLSLTELNRFIPGLNYPSLGRRLGAMRLTGQIEARPDGTRGTPYAATEWLRQAIVPLLAGARWEREALGADAQPLDRLDVESVFLLAVPRMDIPDTASGSCWLAVEIDGAGDSAGVLLTVDQGRLVSCVARRRGHADAWARGSVDDWLRLFLDEEDSLVEVGGDRGLASDLLGAIQPAVQIARQRA